MKQLFLIRGVSGSGKTTLGQRLGVIPIEADCYFERLSEDGSYKFNPALLPKAHQWCQQEVLKDMRDNVRDIAVCNTFTQHWEMAPYLKLAKEFGYQVTIISVKTDLTPEQLSARNQHGVSADVIRKQLARWED